MPFSIHSKPYGYNKATELRHRTSAARVLQKAARAVAGRRRASRVSAKQVNKLSKSVKQLKIAQNGKKQMMRQYAAFVRPGTPGVPALPNTITDIRPLCFLHQAISEDVDVWSLNPQNMGTPTATLEPYSAAIWTKQPYPITLPTAQGGDGLPASYNKFDQLQYWSQAGGVQNDYYHSHTNYTMNFVGQACTGYIDVFLIHPKKSYNPSAQQDISLPNGLPGFTHLTQGEVQQYAINPQYFSCKRIKRHYFNTAAPAGVTPEERELQTNPNFDIKFRITAPKMRRRIKAPELNDGTASLDSTDIPFHKQDWILVSTSIRNADSSDDNFIQCKSMIRTCYWRDYFGSST